MLMVKTENLSKDYVFWVGGLIRKRVRALIDLNLEVSEGEIFAFLGPNGAGKTTTIKLLLGLMFPTKGQAWMQGHPLTDIRSKENVGFLPENPYFYEYLTGKEFLTFYAELYGMGKASREDRIKYLLSLVRMEHAADTQLRKYSRGMLQRIGLAQALINDPKLLFLDEPLSGLDPIGRKEMRDIILAQKDAGKTVFFNSHILSDVEIVADRVGIVLKGELKQIGKISELLDQSIATYEVTITGWNEKMSEIISPLAREVRQEEAETLVVLDNEDQVDTVLKTVSDNKGRVISLIPHRESLEDLFIQQVKGEEGSK